MGAREGKTKRIESASRYAISDVIGTLASETVRNSKRNRALALFHSSWIFKGNFHKYFGVYTFIMDIEPILPNSDGQIVRFPVKLRKIIDTCSTQAISWNQEGTIIRINKRLFEREYLAKENRPFQTTSFSSFIRQLNFYGFQKVNQRPSVKESEDSDRDPVFFDYRHPHFLRSSVDLSLVQRRNKSRRPKNFDDAFARIIEPTPKVIFLILLFDSH